MHTLKSFLIISFLIFPILVLGRDYEVEYGNVKYRLKATKDLVDYQSNGTSLSIAKRSCNAHIIESFYKKLSIIGKTPFLSTGREGFITVKIDNVTGYEPKFGKRAVFLLTMNEKIKKMKIEENLNCSNEKAP